MRVTVRHTKLPIAPRKLRAVLGQLRHRLVPEAMALMLASKRTTTEPIRRLLLASISAAHDRDPALRPDQLSVEEIYAGEGIHQYRTRRKSRGRSARYAKRGSNLTLVVSWADTATLVTPKTAAKPAKKSQKSEVRSQKPTRVERRESKRTKKATDIEGAVPTQNATDTRKAK